MDLGELTDEELALALQQGDERAFAEIVRRHQNRVYAVAYRVTLNREDALDVAQDALLKAFRKIDAWQPSGPFQAWLMRLTANQAIDHIRRRKRAPRAEPDDGAVFRNLADESPLRDGGRAAEASEIGARVDRALAVLSESQRAVFVLRHFEGLQLSDIAATLGCSTGSVKVHLFRALKKMRVELADFRIGPEPEAE